MANTHTCPRCLSTPGFWTYQDNNPLCGFCRAKQTLDEWVPANG